MRLWWLFAVAALVALNGCASRGAVPRPFPLPPAASSGAATPPAARSASGSALAEDALALRGAPYRARGTDPSGFDCSGLVQYVFARHGIPMPREVREQFEAGTAVAADMVGAGDLVFFATAGASASHVGIAVGPDAFVHAPSARGRVRVERLSSPYWASRYLGARRIISPES